MFPLGKLRLYFLRTLDCSLCVRPVGECNRFVPLVCEKIVLGRESQAVTVKSVRRIVSAVKALLLAFVLAEL